MSQKVLYVIRGLPGSGKSTLAKRVAPRANAANDDYFYGPAGYVYDQRLHPLAKQHCRMRIENFMVAGYEQVAVHNTFIRHAHYAEYVQLAKKHGYAVIVVGVQGPFASVHNVPSDVLASMRASWEP